MTEHSNSRPSSALLLLAGAVLFAIAHTQAPLYFSNQHQYFLHGAADGGMGHLSGDWLANTADPTPLFSRFTVFTYRYLHPAIFYAVYFVLIMTYFASLMLIASSLIREHPQRQIRLFAVGCLLIVIHSGIARWASVRLFGVDYPWYLQAGVAGQYAMGPGLQPSSFGVLLISSIAAFAAGRNMLAVMFLSICCWFHATYLLPATLLAIGYIASLYRVASIRIALQTGIAFALSVLPLVVFLAMRFSPTTPEAFAESQEILATLRIPHHSSVQRWLDPIAIAQLVWITTGILLLRRSRLGWALGLTLLMAAVVTLIQAATGNRSLALLFPWRISSILMPIATSVILLKLTAFFKSGLETRLMGWVIVASAVAGGIVIQLANLAYPSDDRELPLLEYIRQNKQPGDMYLIPFRVPAVGSGPRGSYSMSFAPAPGNKDKHLIAVDLQRFRLYTGAPLYVDFKSIPYKDTDVLEWRRRIYQNQSWYEQLDSNFDKVSNEMKGEGITSIIVPANRVLANFPLPIVYEDDVYRVYRLH